MWSKVVLRDGNADCKDVQSIVGSIYLLYMVNDYTLNGLLKSRLWGIDIESHYNIVSIPAGLE